MKPGLLLSFLAAVGVHALLLFGGPGSAAKPLPVSEESATLEASLIDAVPGEASPEPSLPEPETMPTATPSPGPETAPPWIEPPPAPPRMEPEAAPVPEAASLPPKAAPAPAPKKHTVPPAADRSQVRAASVPRLPAAAERSGSGQNALPLGRGNPKPPYPPDALAAGHEGWVIIAIDVSAKGRPVSVELVRSSGFPELDGSALRTVRRWRFFPARQDGKAVASRVELPIRFQIDVP